MENAFKHLFLSNDLMIKLIRATVIAELLLLALSEVVTNPPPNNYTSYAASTLLSVTNSDDAAYAIFSPFSIIFQNNSYRTFYVNTNSYITFGSLSNARSNLTTSVRYPRILIQGRDNVALSLIVKSTPDNITVRYKGYNYDTPATRTIEWVLTFYNSPYEKFDIDIISNNLYYKGDGDSFICTSSSCYLNIDATTFQLSRYWSCPSGKCVNPNTQTCETTLIPYCGLCNYASNVQLSCASCINGFSIDSTSKSCVVCNSTSKFVYFGICYATIPNCQTYNSSDPTICSQCKSNYTGSNCTTCASGYFEYKTGNCGALTRNCAKYVTNSTTCETCSGGYAAPYCRYCDFGYYSNGTNNCIACTSSCSTCKTSICYSCTDGSQLQCSSSSNSSSVKSLSVGAIVGVALGSVVFVAVIVIVVFCLVRRKQNERLNTRIRNMLDVQEMPSQFALSRGRGIYPAGFSALEVPPPPQPIKDDDVSREICSICLEGNPNIVTSCNHAFHVNCLTMWYRKEPKCPNCNSRRNQFYVKCQQCNRYNIGTHLNSVRERPTTCIQCLSKPIVRFSSQLRPQPLGVRQLPSAAEIDAIPVVVSGSSRPPSLIII